MYLKGFLIITVLFSLLVLLIFSFVTVFFSLYIYFYKARKSGIFQDKTDAFLLHITIRSIN